MRIESSVTSISWIPSEAIKGMTKLPFEMGATHYDQPLPDVLDDLDEMSKNDRFRFANELRAYIDVEDGRITDHGYLGHGYITSSRVRMGPMRMVFQPVPFPDIQKKPEARKTSVRFVQTAGGRTGIPTPRRVRRKPFFQLSAPTAWTTLGLTIHADGTTEHEVIGASAFPRHWVYDHERKLAAKIGMIDFKDWYRRAFGKHSPWGDEDSPAFVTTVETALERQLSSTIMRGGKKPKIRRVKEGKAFWEQGQEGRELALLLDGVLAVEVDGNKVAELGPGAIMGERALLETGKRTATLRAITPVKVAVAAAAEIDKKALAEVATGHRREENR